MVAVLFLGVSMAGLHLIPTVARKSLGATDLDVMWITMVLPLCFTFSIWWRGLLDRVVRWRRFFPVLGLCCALPMAGNALAGEIAVLIALMALFYTGQSLYIPLKNRLLQANYPEGRRSRLFSRVSMLQSAVVLLASWGIGEYLDLGEDHWKHLFILLALAGLADRILMGTIPVGEQARREADRHAARNSEGPGESGDATGVPEPPAAGMARPDQTLLGHEGRGWAFFDPPKHMIRELRDNPSFFRWEMQFMLYGMGFFILLTVLPGFLVEGMGLSYATIALGQLGLARFGSMIAMPFFGRQHDRHNSASYCGGVFLLLAGYPLLLLACSLLLPHTGPQVPLLFMAFLVNGLAMGGVHMAWVLSSMRFAKGRDAAVYQSIHVSMTGVRGLIGPPLGWLALTAFGWAGAFGLSAGMLLLASFLMWRQGKTLET